MQLQRPLYGRLTSSAAPTPSGCRGLLASTAQGSDLRARGHKGDAPYAKMGWISTSAGFGSTPNQNPGALPPPRVVGYAGTFHVAFTESTLLPAPEDLAYTSQLSAGSSAMAGAARSNAQMQAAANMSNEAG